MAGFITFLKEQWRKSAAANHKMLASASNSIAAKDLQPISHAITAEIKDAIQQIQCELAGDVQEIMDEFSGKGSEK